MFGALLRKGATHSGQSSVEAAFLIPLIFALLLILLEPGLLLSNQIVMTCAAYEGCRFALTVSDQHSLNGEIAQIEEFVQRRLSGIPNVDIIHAGSWNINVSKSEDKEICLDISHHVKPLPVLGIGLSLVGGVDSSGYFNQSVSVTNFLRPTWMEHVESGPAHWLKRWDKPA